MKKSEKFNKNVRMIDEALHKIVFYATSVNPTDRVTMDVALEALQTLLDVRESKSKLNEQRIINTVADYYNKTPSQITGRSRPGDIVLPRHICMYLIKDMLDLPYTRIGMIFSGEVDGQNIKNLQFASYEIIPDITGRQVFIIMLGDEDGISYPIDWEPDDFDLPLKINRKSPLMATSKMKNMVKSLYKQ